MHCNGPTMGQWSSMESTRTTIWNWAQKRTTLADAQEAHQPTSTSTKKIQYHRSQLWFLTGLEHHIADSDFASNCARVIKGSRHRFTYSVSVLFFVSPQHHSCANLIMPCSCHWKTDKCTQWYYYYHQFLTLPTPTCMTFCCAQATCIHFSSLQLQIK